MLFCLTIWLNVRILNDPSFPEPQSRSHSQLSCVYSGSRQNIRPLGLITHLLNHHIALIGTKLWTDLATKQSQENPTQIINPSTVDLLSQPSCSLHPSNNLRPHSSPLLHSLDLKGKSQKAQDHNAFPHFHRYVAGQHRNDQTSSNRSRRRSRVQ
jgi:hypothetical protein